MCFGGREAINSRLQKKKKRKKNEKTCAEASILFFFFLFNLIFNIQAVGPEHIAQGQ